MAARNAGEKPRVLKIMACGSKAVAGSGQKSCGAGQSVGLSLSVWGWDFYFVTDSFDYASYAFPVIESNLSFENKLPEAKISNVLDGYFRTLFCSKAEERGEKINYIWFQKK